MRRILLAVIALGLGLAATPSGAQAPQAGESPAASPSAVPTRGVSMAQVEQGFGAPSQRLPAVGQPPITRWVYPTFVVYFERSYVIHAVATQRATPAG